jgi:hypothetical protein
MVRNRSYVSKLQGPTNGEASRAACAAAWRAWTADADDPAATPPSAACADKPATDVVRERPADVRRA